MAVTHTHKQRDTRKIVKTKLAIAIEAINAGNIKRAARSHKCGPNQVRKWIKELDKLRPVVARNPHARSLNDGPRVANSQVEDDVYAWIITQRNNDLPVTAAMIITTALSIETNFHGGFSSALVAWVYPFPRRCALVIRAVTHEGQKLSGHIRSVQGDFVLSVMEQFGNDGALSRVSKSGLVNTDETAVFFESKTARTVNKRGARTIAIQASNSNGKHMTICVACAVDGTKLPLMFVFKGKANGHIEQDISRELPASAIACCEPTGWMDERAGGLRLERVWLPHVRTTEESLLMLDEFKCHMQQLFVNRLADAGMEVEFIPGGYTSVLQPCDVGVNRPFKARIREHYSAWTA
ncbi:hypothetical protein PybrP1_000453 [[Pythium] brassicae (nom. inval.)]|nr:hypothetical protein PybrP1_000453 [[Pythium] brassicae (nom. inval.)]